MTNGNSIVKTEYLDGFQYVDEKLEFFPTAEGYVKATYISQSGYYKFNYVYNYTDHLGNIRLSYTKDPNTGELEVLEENHYYPFGLKHPTYESPRQAISLGNDKTIKIKPTPRNPYQYKYNGKELQDELSLNMYAMDFRNYDNAIGRWMNVDPLTEEFPDWTPYNYVLNNPIRMTDPDGMAPDDVIINIKSVSKGGGGRVVTRSVDVKITLTVVNSNKVDLSKTMFNQKSGTVRASEFEGTGQKGYNNNQLVSVDNIDNFTIEYKVVNSLEEVGKDDHILILATELNGDKDNVGMADGNKPGGRISAVETGTISNGTFNTTVKHELGHNLGLKHTDSGLMKKKPSNYDKKVTTSQKGQIVGGVIGMKSTTGTHKQSIGSKRNSKQEAKDFKNKEVKR